jgi:hypothetical protein
MIGKLKAIYGKFLMLDDTPHRIALGIAIGVFVAWTPTVGVQMLAVIPIAFLLGSEPDRGADRRLSVQSSDVFTHVLARLPARCGHVGQPVDV